MALNTNKLKDLTKKELIEIINKLTKESSNPLEEPQSKFSRSLKDCVHGCQTERSKKPSDFEKKNAVKVRTGAESAKWDELRSRNKSKKLPGQQEAQFDL